MGTVSLAHTQVRQGQYTFAGSPTFAAVPYSKYTSGLFSCLPIVLGHVIPLPALLLQNLILTQPPPGG